MLYPGALFSTILTTHWKATDIRLVSYFVFFLTPLFHPSPILFKSESMTTNLEFAGFVLSIAAIILSVTMIAVTVL